MNITDKTVKALRTPKSGNVIHYDDAVAGFGVRVTANGVISFVLNYYNPEGKERRLTIGRYPDYSALAARNEALDKRKEISQGKDPLEEKQQAKQRLLSEPTVADLARDYLERYAVPHKRSSSLRNDRQMLHGVVLPKLGQLRVSAVTKRDIESLHHSLKATPYRANRVRSLLSKMFSLAIEWGWRPDNPVKGVQRFQEDKREAWLSVEQLDKLEFALDSYHDQDVADALRLLTLTGAREGEVLSATWDQFDLKRGVWTKPSHHTKQKRTEHTPLNAPALEILKRMRKANTGPYLFPGRIGDHARVTVHRPWIQVCKAAGLATEYRIPGKRRELIRWKPSFHVHDLRHTFASHLVSKGESLHIVGKLLGHTQPQTTARYAHLADAALRDAANRFGSIIGKKKRPKAAAKAAKGKS